MTLDELPAHAVYHVKGLHIVGTHHVPKGTIRGEMLTAPPPWYEPWKSWFHHVTFNSDLFRADLARVKTVLRESGYYEAQVNYDLEPKGDSISITLRIYEGPAEKVNQVDLVPKDFALARREESALRAQMSLGGGDVFVQKEYDADRQRIERYYLEHGFAYAAVQKEAVVDTGTHQVVVTYTITRGQPAVFGTTSIEGLQHLPPVLARRELPYEPGEPYDVRKAEKAQANIFGLDLFRSVTVEPSNLEENSGVVDMGVHATEGPAHTIKLGIGYGLEDELRGQVEWQDNNFFGDGRRLGIRIKASFITQAFEGEFRQPAFLEDHQTFVLPLTQTREDEPSFTLLQTRIAPRIERRLRPDLTASIGYNIEFDDLSSVPLEVQQRLDQYQSRAVLSSITATAERNTTFDLLDPHEGSVLTLNLEQGGGPWRGGVSFYRAEFNAKKYVPAFLRNQVFAARFRIGGGDAFGQSKDLPLFRRFFSGGINSVRGYDRYMLGPLTSQQDPVGGRSVIEGSVELRTPVYHAIGVVVFLDAGQAKEAPFRYDLGHLRYSAGPGIRYATPIGPLRLDLGFPLNPPPGLPSWQVHFSIGQAF